MKARREERDNKLKLRNAQSSYALRLPRLVTALILTAFFAISRVIFWLMGVRYDASSLNSYWQYLDVDILRYRLLPGLLHLHSQPPGFNLFLGVILKICPDSAEICFNVVYILLGFLLYGSLYYFLRLSQFSKFFAFFCASLFIISPNSVLYENWLFYTYPVAVMLVLAAIALRIFQSRLRTFYAGAFLSMVVLICFVRSSFHVVFLIACIFLVFLPKGIQWRKVGCCALVAVCLVVMLYIKNFVMFGFFGTTSWIGMNLFRTTLHSVGTNTVVDLVKSDNISRIASQMPFNYINVYTNIYKLQHRYSNMPELTAEKKTDGSQNLNHEYYIFLTQEYQSASVYIIRHYPRLYLSGVFDAWLRYCNPSWEYLWVGPNRYAMSRYISALCYFRFRAWVDVQPIRKAISGGGDGPEDLYPMTGPLFISVVFLIACVGSVVRLYKLVRYGDVSGLTFVFMTMTVAYVAVIGNAVEYGENNRFRVETDPLIFLLGVIMCRDICICISRKWVKLRAKNRNEGDVRG